MRKIISIASTAAVAAILLAIVPNFTTSARSIGALISSTWYLELDTAPFGIPGGTVPGLVSFHRDGTLNISDGGDFGGPPISTLNSPQYGSWVRAGKRSFEATSLFIEADLAGVVTNFQNVHLTLEFDGDHFNSLSGFVDVEVVPCDPAEPTPFQTFNCPNPISTPGIPVAFDVPVQLTRLPQKRPNPYYLWSHDDSQ